MSATYTPGPWSIEKRPGPIYEIHASTDAVAVAYGTHLDEDDANARLMAAAPELLEALRDVTRSFEELLATSGDPDPGAGPFVLAAKAAIAKATGGAR